MGRHLFGRWNLGLGRPGLPIAVCDVEECAKAIAWCATHFDQAPPVINLFDPAMTTRRELVAVMRRQGWSGRIVWVPISAISLGIMTARTVLSAAHGHLPLRLAAWSILRPRRYDARVAATVLEAVQGASLREKPTLEPGTNQDPGARNLEPAWR
jgi:hypothetical protein